MQHHFNVDVAKKYGINCAIILQHILFWTERNRAEGQYIYNGICWTQMSKKGMSEYFNYLSEKQISYALDKLIESGMIIKAKSENTIDRRNMYAITNKGYELLSEPDKNDPMDNNKMYQSKIQNVSIKDTKCDNVRYNIYNNIYSKDKTKDKTKDINNIGAKDKTEKEVLETVTDDVLKTALIEFLAMRKKLKKTCTPHALQLIIKRLYKLAADPAERVDIVQQSTRNSWLDVYPLKTDTAREVYSETQKAVKTSNPFILAAMRQEGKNE